MSAAECRTTRDHIDGGPVMRAAWYETVGPAESVLRVGLLPVPQPRNGEVLVEVMTSGINPHDTKKRSGWLGQPMATNRIVPHADGAGRIVEVGAGVSGSRVGQRVWFFRADEVRPGHGSAAEFVVLLDTHAVLMPDSVSFETGACLGVPALTAYAAVFGDGPVAGRDILVQGGTGAVGGYAVQMASQAGARVIATVSSGEKAAHARALGAREILNYRQDDVVSAVLSATGGVDRIIEVDFGANIAIDAAVIRNHGVIASYSSTSAREPVLPYYSLAFKGVTVHFLQGMILSADLRADAVRHVSNLLHAGKLKHPPVERFPLERIVGAHRAVEFGLCRGKAILWVQHRREEHTRGS